MHQNAIKRLSEIVKQLSQNASETDKFNSKLKSHRLIENNALFSSALFLTQSDKFLPYAQEIDRKLIELNRLMAAGKSFLFTALLASIEQQVQALVKALSANEAMHNEAKIRLDSRAKTYKKSQYKQLAKAVLQSSHQLHQKLAEHHEFERRLLAMITDREQLRNSNKHNPKLAEEVLALHQRLGRCRKAISTIERDIEFSEKRT